VKEPKWLLPDILVAVHKTLLLEHGGVSGIRDEGLLESALNRPRTRFEYGQRPSIFDLAACYCNALAKNHPFIDGNKRIALVAGALFLELNGFSLRAPEAEAVVIMRELAAGRLTEPELAAWLKRSSQSAMDPR